MIDTVDENNGSWCAKVDVSLNGKPFPFDSLSWKTKKKITENVLNGVFSEVLHEDASPEDDFSISDIDLNNLHVSPVLFDLSQTRYCYDVSACDAPVFPPDKHYHPIISQQVSEKKIIIVGNVVDNPELIRSVL